LGIRSVLVKTGEFRARDLEAGIEPDFVLDSIADLVELLTTNTEFGDSTEEWRT
jgi:ribonucleotide monophosphatase NagD (HAD superfamily)